MEAPYVDENIFHAGRFFHTKEIDSFIVLSVNHNQFSNVDKSRMNPNTKPQIIGTYHVSSKKQL